MNTASPKSSGFSAELNLLLRCARVRPSPGAGAAILQLVRRPLDWSLVVKLAERHRVAPLLCRHINVCAQCVPEHALAELKAATQRTATRNLFLTWQLLDLIDRFRTAGISVIAFKGPSLAAALYGDVALRPFDDLDLFVRKADVPGAQAVLLRHGFRALHPLTDGQEARHLETDCERCYVEDRHRVAVDLHWASTPGYFSIPFEPQKWWERSSVMTLGDREVSVLSPEDLLLYLCVHGAKHSWQRLLWVTDVAELVSFYPALCYDALFERAAAQHSTRMLFLGLALAKALLGLDLPKAVEERLSRDRAIPGLVAQVADRLGQPQAREDMIAASAFRVRSRERFIDRASYGFKLATTSTMSDWSWIPLPQFLSPLYHVLRPVRLILQRGLGLGIRNLHTTPADHVLPRS